MTVPMQRKRDWLNTKEVASLLDVSHWTLRSWRRRQQGPPCYRMQGSIRYDRSEVEAWRESKRYIGDGTLG